MVRGARAGGRGFGCWSFGGGGWGWGGLGLWVPGLAVGVNAGLLGSGVSGWSQCRDARFWG